MDPLNLNGLNWPRTNFQNLLTTGPAKNLTHADDLTRTLLNSILGLRQIHPKKISMLPNLKQSSALCVAITLWNQASVNAEGRLNENFQPGPDQIQLEHKKLFKDVDKLLARLSVQQSIVDYIFTFVAKMSEQIDQWAAYHRRSLCYSKSVELALNRFIPNFSWNLDTTIEYKKTALNLLQSRSLNTLEKYKLSCLYCFEEQLAKLAPLVFVKNSSFGRLITDFASNALEAYWTCYFEKKLLKLDTMPSDMNGYSSIYSFMFQHTLVDNWWSKEYFFKLLNPEEKVQGAVWLIDRFGGEYQKLVLSRMNESERINVYVQRAVKIISNYSKDGKYAQEILSTWFEIRNLINAAQFVSVISHLLQSRKYDGILMVIWASVCDDFKDRILTSNVGQIIEKIFQVMTPEDNSDCANEFLFAILSDIDFSTKKPIIGKPVFRNYCEALFKKREFPKFERLIREFVQVGELEQRRQDIILNSMAIKNRCFELYSVGELQVLNYFLAEMLPSASPDLVQEYKKNLLMSADIIEQFANRLEQTSIVLEAIFADGLPNGELQAEFKRRLMYSSRASSVLRSWLVRDRFPSVKHYVEHFLSSQEDRKVLKNHLLTNSKREDLAIIFCNYGRDIAKIEEMLCWCLEDEESLRQYKSSQDIDAIFDWLLNDAVFGYRRPERVNFTDYFSSKKPEFSGLELFLIWYFKSPCEIKDYKLKRIDSYREIPTMKALLENKSIERRFKLKHVLRWFFDNDQEKIEEFKLKFSIKT